MAEELSRVFASVLGSELGNRMETQKRVRETPNPANQVQYPKDFNNGVPVIIAAPLQKAKVSTIIIAMQSKGYTENSFQTDVRKTVDYFGLQPNMYHQILLKPASEELQNVLDSADATNKLRYVVEILNENTVLHTEQSQGYSTTQLPTGAKGHLRFKGEVVITTFSRYNLRIVSLGVATPGNFIFTALEFLVNG